MNRFQADFSRITGKIKPMHSVNNGPAGSRGMSNAPRFTEAGIPYARLHDSAFYAGYGGAHSVDVAALFPDFSADVNDPASYDFTLTDKYLQEIVATGTKVFYRLGNKIEHEIKKYGTQVPPDFQKWAEISEHIILHYNEGWADGFHMGIEYWEIWNEPDCRNPDGSNPCWQGTDEQFCEMFYVAITYLKERFPQLKFGGPALCYVDVPFTVKLLDRLTKDGGRAPLDFYSYHGYDSQPGRMGPSAAAARELLDKYGYTGTEIILNEWNYVRQWGSPEAMRYAYNVIRGLKGASFVAAVMCVMQPTVLDQLMYYDARPGAWNGMFDASTIDTLKGYFPFRMFNELYKLGGAVENAAEGELFGCAAVNENGDGAIMLTRYTDADEAEAADVLIEMAGLPQEAEITYRLLDAEKDMAIIRTDRVYGGKFATQLPMKLFDTLLLTVKAL